MKENMLKVFLITSLFVFTGVLAISIESCKSGSDNWRCSSTDICICKISGTCSHGDLLVYKSDLDDLLCIPEISGSTADIDWDNCKNPTGKIWVKADCDEGQSSEKEITIVSSTTPTTSPSSKTTTTQVTPTTMQCNYVCQATCTNDNDPPLCYRKTSRGSAGCPTGLICCESAVVSCPEQPRVPTTTVLLSCPYECCVDIPGYEYKTCYGGLLCQDHICKQQQTEQGFSIPRSLIFWVILASLIPILAFLIFIWRKNSDSRVPEY